MTEDRQQRADLDAAASEAALAVRVVVRSRTGDDPEQLVAIGPEPTGRPVLVATMLFLAMACAIGFAVAYTIDEMPVFQGVFLGGALLLVGAALISWSKRLLPQELAIEQRERLDDREADDDGHDRGDDGGGALGSDLARPELEQPGRRMLIGSLIGAGIVIAGAVAFPFRSLGPRPGDALARTSWRAGLRVVDSENRPIHKDDVALEGSLTVFPEGHTDAGDSQVMLVRVPAQMLSASTQAGGTVDGRVAYSKVCSHAGCPVGQFRTDSRGKYELLCPCHQSLFDVLEGCKVLAGPAGSPLPQLPLSTDDDGFLIATGDFPSPIGPSYWNKG